MIKVVVYTLSRAKPAQLLAMIPLKLSTKFSASILSSSKRAC